jgi:hypothetical protein
MSELAVQGHGARIGVEMGSAPNYTPVTGTFTDVPELGGEIQWPTISVPETEATAHNDNIDFWKPGVAQRDQLQFTVNYVASNTVHAMFLAQPFQKTERGWRLRGPGWTTPGTDEVIASGFIQAVGPVSHPNKEGLRTMPVMVRLSGPMIVNGTVYGAPT